MAKQSLSIRYLPVFLISLMLLWTVSAVADHHEPSAAAVKNVYVCGCGPASGCDRIADQPGSCPCGKPLIEKQVLGEEADRVYVCACADDCKCAPNPTDPAKCACGKELRAYPKQVKVACAQGLPAAADRPGCAQPCCEKPCCQKPCCQKPCGAKVPAQ